MDPDHKLPDPGICRTRQIFDTIFYLCLVECPVSCPQLNVIRGTALCNHYFRRDFAEKKPPRNPAADH
jgi:hypothetical protein